MDKEYAWNFNKDAEVWANDTFTTIEECIKDARRIISEEAHYTIDYEAPSVVYIGEVIPFIPTVDCTDILDRMEEDAFDHCGEAAELWETYDYKKKDEIDELDQKLTDVVLEWLKKYNREPHIYNIQKIKEYSLEVQG